LLSRATTLLETWAEAVEPYWNPVPGRPDLGCYGPGYAHWGVQSNWNYAAALALLSARAGVERAEHWRARALASYRYALATHLSGTLPAADGRPWGHGWISMLGIERAMFGLHALQEDLTTADRAALRAMLISEANWVVTAGHRGGEQGVIAGLWNGSGRNAPESNIWTGSLLWRTAALYPDEPAAALWRERAHAYFINGISIPADAQDETVLAGKPVRERHVGANYFPNYALDHHGYLNVGYMAICLSNAAILHFDAHRQGFEVPETLYFHQSDLWRTLRRFLFADGRLLRLGGDSRVRYAYCQEYLLPGLLLAADHFGDPHALDLISNQLGLMEQEAAAGPDGAFYSRRLSVLRDRNLHYYTRLESDRACVLGMLLAYLPMVQNSPRFALPEGSDKAGIPFNHSASGSWAEPEHGALLERSERRIAAFSWRAHGLSQGLCLPADGSDLAEWALNLAPLVRFLEDDGAGNGSHRRLLGYTQHSFPGGFATCGVILEGVEISVDEGAHTSDQAIAQIAFAALPDDQTCVGFQRVTAAADRVGYLWELKGLHFNLPNDLFNGFQRMLYTANGTLTLSAPAAQDEILELGSSWANIDDRLGVLLLSGAPQLLLSRSAARRGGKYRSLFVEELCSHAFSGQQRVAPGSVLLDIGFAVLAGASAAQTAARIGGALSFDLPDLRGIWVLGADGARYSVLANFGDTPSEVQVDGRLVTVPAGECRVVVM
jgi:hypothetical protein